MFGNTMVWIKSQSHSDVAEAPNCSFCKIYNGSCDHAKHAMNCMELRLSLVFSFGRIKRRKHSFFFEQEGGNIVKDARSHDPH